MNNYEVITLNEFIVRKQAERPGSTGALTSILQDIIFAAKIINREVSMAGLVDIIGQIGRKNAFGEEVKKLDEFATYQLTKALKTGGACCGIASEEGQTIEVFDNEMSKNAKYVVLLDPLDGSSNIDVNVSIGTIFSIFERKTPIGMDCEVEDFLQAGKNQVAAGYVIYGSSTMLVYSTGNGVHGFTLDPSIGEFCLSHENIQTPDRGKYYSVNEGYKNRLPQGVLDFIDYCKVEDPETKRPIKARYIGSMVSDIHRNLIKGGIFVYPAMKGSPNGKLRLLYECNAMAYIVENAGGMASNGDYRILEMIPSNILQCAPIFIGSKDLVNKQLEFLEKAKKVELS